MTDGAHDRDPNRNDPLLERLVAGEPLSAAEQQRVLDDPQLALQAQQLLGVIEYLERDAHERETVIGRGVSANHTRREQRVHEQVLGALGGSQVAAAQSPPRASPARWRLLGVIAAVAATLLIVWLRPSPSEPSADRLVMLGAENGFEVAAPQRLANGAVRVRWTYDLAPFGYFRASLWSAGTRETAEPRVTSGELDEVSWTLNPDELAQLSELSEPLELELVAFDAVGEIADLCVVPFELP